MDFERKFFRFLTTGYFNRNARRVWGIGQKGESLTVLSEQNIGRILDSTWKIYSNCPNEIQKSSNLGNWMVIRFGHLTLAAYHALQEFGLDKETSIDLMRKLTWYITSTWAERGRWFANIFLRSNPRKLEFFVNIVMTTMFCPPAYKFDQGNIENGFYLDVHQCPVAELMISRGEANLCIETWCGVDFGLVEIFGAKLFRTGTLAMGKDQCDFRFVDS